MFHIPRRPARLSAMPHTTFPLVPQVLGDLGIAFPQSVLRDSTVIMCIITFKVCHALATVVAHYYMSFCVKQATLQRHYMDSSQPVREM